MKLTPENMDYEDCRPPRKVRGILLPTHLWDGLSEEDRAEQEALAARVEEWRLSQATISC
jgi:hypothetical protein